MPRARLLDVLQQARELRCIVITSPAGSGKTALLRTWARKASARRTTLVWLDGSAPLAGQLLLRCAEADPALAGVLPDDLPEQDDEALVRVAIALVRAAGTIKRRIALVFDGLHLLPDASVLQGLQPLLDHAPPHLQCVFASRDHLPLSLGRLREHDQLLELHADDLAFTASEAQALWRWQLGPRAFASAEASVQGWQEAAGGWGMAVASIGRAVNAGLGQDAWLGEAFDLLDAEVLDTLSLDQRRMLMRLSCAEAFDTTLAAHLGRSPPAECASFLERFATTGFLTRTQGDGNWWQLHPTLASRLRRLFAREPATTRRNAHRLASIHLAECGRQSDAVRQAMASGDTRRAADLVEGWAGDLFKSGQHEPLAALVRLVLPSSSLHRPRLRLWITLLALMEHRFNDCAVMIAALERDVSRRDRSTRRRMRVLKCWLAVFLDDMEAAAGLLADPRAKADPEVDEITLAAERNVLSWIHIYRNDYQRARDVQARAAAKLIAAPRGTLFGSLTGRCMAGLSLALEGRMDAAERTYRDVLEDCRSGSETDPACIDAAALATGLLGETLYELGDLRGVLALEPRLADIKHRSLPDTLLRVMLAICRSHALQDRIDDALRIASELQAYADARKLDRLTSYALLEQLRLHLLRQDPASAQAAWEKTTRLRAVYDRAEGTTLSEVTVVADRAEILVLMYQGRFELARKRIATLIELCRRRGRHRRVAALHFQHAVMDRELGARESAARHALMGLRLGAQLGLVRSLLDAHPDVPDFLCEALALNGHETMLAFHADRLRAAAGFGPLRASALSAMVEYAPARAQAPGVALSQREEEIAQLLAQALPNKEIARELGLSPETVKWHLRNVFAKLGVGKRYQALALLRERSTR
ncbi:Serine/threonine-protein kinase PknK [Variovorax sp. PBL-H6]|uniref:LuxR C-terminal-related transcriptional regulator n=1 Tax=Variovorax sp. PBL-H6 TaxID=434009 RepID=UPI0013163892|nr:LuxR C-terminal-related transcriptional regulator [Variovorax sp. PBL-H6]VTU27389.1 Serine/threonine-protein kinase PknK [Variovorax sp. PBL-H6]